jgi:hypothetical protein
LGSRLLSPAASPAEALLAARVAARLALVAACFSSGDKTSWAAESFFVEDGVTENLSSGGLWNHHTGNTTMTLSSPWWKPSTTTAGRVT